MKVSILGTETCIPDDLACRALAQPWVKSVDEPMVEAGHAITRGRVTYHLTALPLGDPHEDDWVWAYTHEGYRWGKTVRLPSMRGMSLPRSIAETLM